MFLSYFLRMIYCCEKKGAYTALDFTRFYLLHCILNRWFRDAGILLLGVPPAF